MTNINKILSRTNCASNHAATGVYQGDVLGSRYRVRVDPERDLFCVVDRKYLSWFFRFPIDWDSFSWTWSICDDHDAHRYYWPDFDDALAFAKLLDKAL